MLRYIRITGSWSAPLVNSLGYFSGFLIQEMINRSYLTSDTLMKHAIIVETIPVCLLQEGLMKKQTLKMTYFLKLMAFNSIIDMYSSLTCMTHYILANITWSVCRERERDRRLRLTEIVLSSFVQTFWKVHFKGWKAARTSPQLCYMKSSLLTLFKTNMTFFP